MIEIKKKYFLNLELDEEQMRDLLIALNYNAGKSNMTSCYSEFMERLRQEVAKSVSVEDEE